MKAGICTVLSWWAFAHLTLIAVTLFSLEAIGVPQQDFPGCLSSTLTNAKTPSKP